MAPSTRVRGESIEDVRQTIDNGNLKDRQAALDDLIFFFSKKTKAADLSALNDKHYHQILDTLFRCALSEKQSFLGAKKTARASAPAKLAKCAEALRVVIESGASRLKRKTLVAIIDHITQTLPGPDADLVEPLLQGYIKALMALLSHPANVELLATYDAEGWYDCVDFSLQTITRYIDAGDTDSDPYRSSPAPTAQTFSMTFSTPRSSAISSQQRNTSHMEKSRLHDLLNCLLSLISAANAPLQKRVKDISSIGIQVLKLPSSGVAASLQVAFSVINVALSYAQTDDVEYAGSIAAELVPLIGRWWQAKIASKDDALLNNLQVEMLKALYSMHMQLESLVQKNDSTILASVEDLCDLLWSAYTRRDSRSQLQQDDLSYSTVPRHQHSLATHVFGLRLHNIEAERRWAVVHTLSLMEATLWRASHLTHTRDEDEQDQPRKKRRMASGYTRLRQRLLSPDLNVQLAALQVVPFFIANVRVAEAFTVETLSSLVNLTAHKNANISVWAMIATASIAQTEHAKGEALAASWKQLWFIASRNLSIQGTCRAACLLLHMIVSRDLVQFHDISDDVHNIVTAADVNGPAIMVDSSVILMTKLLQLTNHHLPSTSFATCSHVVRWLFLRWDPADSIFTSFYSTLIEPIEIINLLRVACGVSHMILTCLPQSVVGPLGEAWGLLQERKDIIRYLLLLPDDDKATSEAQKLQYFEAAPTSRAAQTSDTYAVRKLIAELLYPRFQELVALCATWNARGDGSSHISPEKLESVMGFVTASFFCLPLLTEAHVQQTQNLEASLFDLLKNTLIAASLSADSRFLHERVLRIIRPYIPSCRECDISSFAKESPQALNFFSKLSDEYQQLEKQTSGHDEDGMDLDDEFGSQESRSTTMTKGLEISRRETVMLDANSFHTDTKQRLHLLKILRDDTGQVGLVPQLFLESFLALSDEELLLSKQLGRELLTGDAVISPDDQKLLIERFGTIMASSTYSSCETALALVLDVIEGLMPSWTDKRSGICDEVGDFYRFFVKNALPNNLLSDRIQTVLARLMLSLTMIDEKYPEALGIPNTIESVLGILELGSVPVKFYIANRLPVVFGRFVLKAHDDVFAESILHNLPTEPDFPEGISFRLYVLAELAQNWPTLLRRCVYHLFETAGQIHDSAKHASYCLRKIATSLQLESSRNLFKLFAPQLLYTWLSEDSIENIPFEIFGYASLEELLKHAQSEAAAIMMMRGHDQELASLARHLGLDPVQLVQRSFSKVLAFGISYDLSTRQPENAQKAESRIRKLMGRESYLENVYINFVDTIGQFFLLIDQEGPVEHSWSKDESLVYAAEAMAEIKGFGHSEVELAPNQQPTFKAKHLSRELALLCSRTESSGNAERDTHESNLLLEILRDEGNKNQLLSETSRKIALGILCKDFHVPDSFRSDAVNSDDDATAISTAVWKSSSQAQYTGDDYLVWAARVIGRSFSASGNIDLTLLRESHLTDYLQRSSGGSSSEQGLLDLMQSLTGDIHCFTAGIVESSLRTIVSEAAAQEDNDLLEACGRVLSQELLAASDWLPYRTPPSDNSPAEARLDSVVFSPEALEDPAWAQHVTIHLIQSVPGCIILDAMPQVLEHVQNFAEAAFPFIVHLVLLAEHGQRQSAKKSFSAALREWLKLTSSKAKDNLSLIINMLLFLRTQKFPGESSIADRSQWLDIDLTDVASAAARCGMHKTALLFVESSANEGARQSRRSSAVRAQDSTDVLLDIFENIDDPDAYYGLPTSASLENVLARLDYEKNGSKSLAFRGAHLDSHIRKKDPTATSDGRHLVNTLSNLGLAGLSHSLLQSQQNLHPDSTSVDNMFDNARRLEIWNIPAPPLTNNPSAILYKAYQGCYQAVDMNIARQSIYSGLKSIMENAISRDIRKANVRHNVAVLAALTEMDDILHVADATELDDLLASFEARSHWMKSGRYEDVMQILSCRETTLSMLGHTLPIRTRPRRDAAARLEGANALWDHQEMVSSIRMLQSIEATSDLKKQTVLVQRSDLLAKIGHQVSVAKLEKPDNIQKNYLQPALKELRGRIDGQEAGKVYHQFAMFCDEQLQNTDSLKDLSRLRHLREGKNDEVVQLKGLVASAKESQMRNRYQIHLAKAKQWLDLDDQELRRVEQSRSEFVRLSLENYLLSLTASDEHNNDALRFTALWLERSGEDMTNEAVKRYIDKVPTRKFAALMNQLSSRLVDQSHQFQRLLIELVYRISIDHPYHGMYQIWSGMRSRTNNKDDVAVLRQRATEKVGKKLGQTPTVSTIWTSIDKTSKSYHMLATERDTSRYKAGQKIAIKESSAGLRLLQDLTKYQIPPPTMQIELSADKDYSRIPYVTKLEDSMSIASGVSAPKIITLVGSNGKRFKQLVFAAASSVLKLHRSTQQRNLGIRTYKVLPLTASSGLIEFVPNTIPFHEYLMPAHERYHPKDYKGSQCRKEISQVQNKSVETRVATYKKVTDRFQPVMRYFFMENFSDPDEWYAKRTAYTRTTAAISILGHVLGLGDRHGHNILLDSVSGEVVHIDLGVAFEMGRILPVPELVPFRLTRDIVDGMGITKTEGAFRRCCEFTLDALREETYTIMTILDVLRYDPLYSWSISPVRMAKLQTPRTDEGEEGPTDAEIDSRKKRGVVNEPSEADRALEVVRKKLSKTLSVSATVNDLINQATDERNLAVLYSGWAAYA
ncbi:Serine/threonine-protein kinase TEL1 [Apiospora hydei]|uniref:Serine/threonine-protein kinase Tel1 n=1 Tax=Apiospora hydei TaxID=1337664 RepID=A0ABR1X419_9PEZI